MLHSLIFAAHNSVYLILPNADNIYIQTLVLVSISARLRYTSIQIPNTRVNSPSELRFVCGHIILDSWNHRMVAFFRLGIATDILQLIIDNRMNEWISNGTAQKNWQTWRESGVSSSLNNWIINKLSAHSLNCVFIYIFLLFEYAINIVF